jgi:insertion element IS1 protein InsB
LSDQKKNGTWIGTAVDNFKAGILSWVLGTRSAPSFRRLWKLVNSWGCYFYVTEGLPVYPGFIPDEYRTVIKFI